MSETIIYGIHAISHLLEQEPRRLLTVFCTDERHDARLQRLVARLQAQQIAVQKVKPAVLMRKTAGGVHQGVVALIQQVFLPHERDLFALLATISTPLLLLLDGVTDPHNLGACLRSAYAAGVDAVIIPRHRAVQLNATVRKVACGAADALPVIVVTNLVRTIRGLQEQGIWVVGTADEAPQTLYHLSLKGPLAFVMGSEEKGLRHLTRLQCDVVARLPMVGAVSSLNVSVATGICLFEAVRQRRNGEVC